MEKAKRKHKRNKTQQVTTVLQNDGFSAKLNIRNSNKH